MTNPIFTSGMAAARRAMRRHQGAPPRSSLPMWKLLLGELVYLLRQLAKPRRLIPALVAATLIAVGLSPWTPGPVAEPALRVLLASVAAALGVWAGPRFVSQPETGHDRGAGGTRDPEREGRAVDVWSGGFSILGSIVLVVAIAAALGWLLALIMAAIY